MAIDETKLGVAMKDIQDRPGFYEALLKHSPALRHHLQEYGALACEALEIPAAGPGYRSLMQAIAAAAQIGWALREHEEG